MSIQRLVCILSSIILLAGCSKQTSPNNAAQAAWSQESVNHLLPYAPSNTPLLMASTHTFETQNGMTESIAKPVLDAILTQFSDVKAQIAQQTEQNNDSNINKKNITIKPQIDSYIHLLRNFAQDAPEWGLHPNGHDEYIVYVSHDAPVLKFTTADVDTFKSHMQTQGMLSSIISSGIIADHLQNKELTIDGESWTFYDITPMLCHGNASVFEPVCQRSVDEHHYAAAMAIHYGKDNIVTTTLLLDDKDTILPDLLKKADVPLTTTMLSYMTADVHHFTDLNPSPLSSLVINKLTQMLRSDVIEDNKLTKFFKLVQSVCAQYPSIHSRTRLNGNEVTIDNILETSNRDDLSAFQSITQGTRPFSQNIQAGIQFSANFQKSFDIFYQRAQNIMGDTRFMYQLKKEFSSMRSYVTPIDAIHVEIKQFNLGTDSIDFDGKISLYGEKIHTLVEQAYSMFGNENLPELNTPRPQQLLDTTEMLSAPLDEVIRESEYSLASSSYDLNAPSNITEPKTLLALVIKKTFINNLLPRFNFYYHDSGMCRSLNISEYECNRLPVRFLNLFDDKAGIEIKVSSTETAETYQLKYNLSVK